MVRLWLIFFTGLFFCTTIAAQEPAKIDSLRYLAETTTSDSAAVYLMVQISQTYSSTDIQDALVYAEKAVSRAKESAQKSLEAYALFNMGNVYFEQGMMELALQYYFECLRIHNETGGEKGQAYVMANVGAVYLQLKQFDQSREYFENALAYFERLDMNDSLAQPARLMGPVLNNLGIVCQTMEDYPCAINYYSRGISLMRILPGYEQQLAMLLNNLGSVYVLQGKTDQALDLIKEAFVIRKNNDDLSGLAQSHRMLAEYYVAVGDRQRAIQNLNLGHKLALQVGSMSLDSEILKLLYEVYQNEQIADSALKYYIKYSDINEELNQEAALKELKHLEIKAQYEENAKRVQEEQKRKEQRYLLAGIGLLLTLAILGLLYFLSQSRNRRLRLEKENIHLNAQNLELQNANLEKELSLKKKEMATNVMYQIQKNELIHDIVKKMQKHSIAAQKQDKLWVYEIIRDLEKTQDMSVWDEFEIRFQQVHSEFYTRLNNISPDLSVNERRLCAFLKLNMTSKEISSITGQTPRTIDVARTRLRKKLNLTNTDQGLVEYLSGI